MRIRGYWTNPTNPQQAMARYWRGYLEGEIAEQKKCEQADEREPDPADEYAQAFDRKCGC